MLRDVRGTVEWEGKAGSVSRDVEVLNISGGGVAVVSEEVPPLVQVLRLELLGESARIESVEAQLKGTSYDD